MSKRSPPPPPPLALTFDLVLKIRDARERFCVERGRCLSWKPATVRDEIVLHGWSKALVIRAAQMGFLR